MCVDRSKRARATLGAALALVLWPQTAAASANTCGGVSPLGECWDAHTVIWCQGGEIAEVACAPTEICARHDAFDGGYGCIDRALTACAHVPDEGLCTSANNVVWCTQRGEVAVDECAADEVCAFNEAEGWVDCMAANAGSYAPPTATPEPPDADEEEPEAPAPVEPRGEQSQPRKVSPGPGPAIAAADEAQAFAGGDGAEQGCAGGGAPGGPWALAVGLLSLALVRRRAEATHP